MARRAEIVLDPEEREVLERWVRRPKSSQALAFRCRVVLAAAEGRSSTEIAAELACNPSTVGRWRGRFAERGLDGLHDEPRPGKPRSISDEQVEQVIVKTLEEQPLNATHWSTRSMAAATGMSQTAISRIWRAFGLKPHQTEAFKLSPDPQFIDKVRDRPTTTSATAPRTCTRRSTSPPAR
jgi:transposase